LLSVAQGGVKDLYFLYAHVYVCFWQTSLCNSWAKVHATLINTSSNILNFDFVSQN
jgi:hypothetical protein